MSNTSNTNRFITELRVQETVDADGNVIESSTSELTRSITRTNEPDYIKIYTNMWCEFNQIPLVYRELFLALATRMSYANSIDITQSQIVFTGKPVSDSIMTQLGWKKSMYHKGIKALCDCGAIRKIARGLYQISPSYAGKGEWKYNPRLERGGIEDLIAVFSFKDRSVETKVIWGDDGSEAEYNQTMRTGLGVKAEDRAMLKTTDIQKKETLNHEEYSDIEAAFS